MKKYEGILDPKKMCPQSAKAYGIYNNQKDRCYNPKRMAYKYYGGKGICVEYSAREFIGWWLEKIKDLDMKKPTCGRIDHNKSYNLNNIEIVEQKENSSERCKRLGHPSIGSRKKVVLLDDNGEEAIIFESIKSAEKYLKIAHVHEVCSGKFSQTKGFKFRYYHGG